MAYADETDGADRAEALLWAAPTGPLPAPPIETKAQVLPIGDLHWPDAERLFLRLLHTVRPVQYAKLFGVPGQAQAGIDAYARLPLDLIDGETGGRDYITLQSRRIQSLTAAKIKKAVDDLLKGEWARKTAAFHFATSFDLQATKLDAAIRDQTERLAKLGITFVPWGVQEVSTLLKDQPRIVDDFFGRPWVERFCGQEAARALANNLSHQDSRELRAGLHDLYRAVFYAQGGVHPIENTEPDQQFVILDVDSNRQQSNIVDTERREATGDGQEPGQSPVDGHTYIASRLGTRRQSFRSARWLLNSTGRSTPATVGTVGADEWLAGGKYRLLIGRPGAGKSSLLRFAATDLLSSQPQSIALQRKHATDLPIWLPFGFLCRHLEASTENSLVSAAEAWLKSQSAAHLWPLVECALQDDRLLLLVDGVDEWSDVRAAERALGLLEAFLGRTNASAILSTRPYAVDRLNWRLPWAQAEITPLTDEQRRTIAAEILLPVTHPESVPAAPSAWSAGVEPFLDQLAATTELAELSRSPLFLTLLAATWQGEPLPRQRFKIYARLVELLIEKHPQMRQRASHADGGPLTATEVSTLFAAVAYHLRVKDPAGTVTKPEMRKLIVESMTDDEVLGYEQSAARKIADAVLAMAEDEFGLVVSHGAGAFGFLHRVVLDHMAGQYLATLPADAQVEAVRRFIHDPAWRDVLLALLTAQVSSHATAPLLTAALDAGGGRWADVDGYELVAEALAAGVKLTPRSQAVYSNRLVERVETHPSLRHRANLITALVGTLASHSARSHLLPIMKRWLTAPRPNPSPTMWALRDLDIADDVAAECLLWGIRHPEDNVKVNGALAIARRFGGQPRPVHRLVALTETGPSSATQAAAILALGNGWAEAPETTRLIGWARCQPSMSLRLVGLHLLQRGTARGDAALFRPEERDWLLSLLRQEDFRGPWPVADLVNIAATANAQAADFALETLTTNGRTGGDRELAWALACNAFADDSRFKAWVAAELAAPEERSLILYDVGMIPQQWRDDPEFAQTLHRYADAKLREPVGYSVAGLASLMPADDARTVLLRGLDTWRPYPAARILIERYADDEHVRTALTSRLRGDHARAAPMAGVAIDVLGTTEGFAVLVSLLRQPPERGRTEEQVVVAEAVADAWKRFEDAALVPGAEGETAREVLASYDPAELAALCTAVNPHHLMWHVPAVIAAWPGQPAVHEFADKLIHDTKPISSGIPDTIPVAILRAYCGRTDEPSRRILDKTLNLLKHIEPELREVLAFELARSSLAANDLIDVMAEWRNEPDTEVRRNAFIGLVQAIKRNQHAHDHIAGAATLTAEMEWLRKEIKEDLCAYGPELDERRQLAWIGMLMLGDLTLSDGIQETLGHEGQVPGVKLDVLYDDDVDQILVDLVAENWERLHAHFGGELFQRLNSTSDRQRRTVSEQRRHVMSALATVASRYPAIAEMLRNEADTDAALRQERHFLLWAKEENRGDEGALRALVAKLGPTLHRQQDQVLDSLLDRDSWNVSDEAFKAILTEDALDARSGRIYVSKTLAAYAQLFPSDNVSIAALRDLESWFRTDRATRGHREWDDTLAIAFGTADPQDLPAVVTRAHTRIRMGMPDWYLPMFTKPLLRRLRLDPDAVEALKTALSKPMDIREDSPIFAAPWDPIADACSDLQPLQRTYLFAVVLRQAGALPQQDAVAATSVLASASPDTVVHNPFTHHEGPLCLAALDLAAR
ncbi:NACHT domain-containing protein [Micromonospora rhizosphaerae]|uniref:NACHT domain-containing protein n=1 Tax=Micromonospora rhizosphaerae TaxID=568872 RepID=A0A1C6TAX6_9ACTN|nr:NACHT domain-containing protein [Micromonospora rhizosphaerae]SCL38829.1 NACHT domain-containing protein [Micromonospora rhizosphaerae]